ncbi:DIS3-like exonuclease 2 [Melipona quadrifasciata]|uniref:DIS3-like exonuclease 2 n=1 Tax=Melipona quadrifasciata TaxID=166423 RepID=A0A0N0BJL7_9HYME|nr:DIS3-like exonuclease 2 [Melipona quadrifasciata]
MSNESIPSDFVAQNQLKITKLDRKINKRRNKGKISDKRSVPVDAKAKQQKNIEIQTPKSPKRKETFPQYISEKQIDNLLRNENSNGRQYIEGQLRINPRCHKYAYLSLSDDQYDLLIVGLKDRNRAFDGDFVVACINQPDKWHTYRGQKQKTGVVVYIREKVHPRKTVGCFKQRGAFTFLYPRDHRIPLVQISKESLQQFNVCPSSYEDTLYLVVITDWVKPKFAIGKIEKVLGNIGDIKAESNAILLECDLDVTPYAPYGSDVMKGLPDSDYSLTENDVKNREDWRGECIFTIDPVTAVDLDDSVSCKSLENGNYEIGVHISDVTHYIEFLSPLDIQISKRATTIYMTDNVYHMLPKQLCQVCSLSPGQDKLAFSVIWEMTQDAKVVKYHFAKTVIRSCCQMSYQHVQKLIENPKHNWPDDFLNINGNYKLSDLSTKVNILHNLATQMRKRRFQNGALQIDQPKLYIMIDETTGLPISYDIEERQDSNREPSKHVLNMTQDTLQKLGIHLDVKSSASLHASIKRYEQELETENDDTRTTMKYRMMVINNLCSRAMTRATYICSSSVKAEKELRHYALNVSLYTHFTSPIRRYSDCVVHRLLYSTLENVEMPKEWTKKLCKSIAANCNIKKYRAKIAQERSSELYFTYLIDLKGPMITMGIVLAVNENFVNVILCQFGLKLSLSFTQLENLADVKYSSDCSVPTINIFWKQPPVTQVINIFTLLYLKIEKHPKSFQLIGNFLPPNSKSEILL